MTEPNAGFPLIELSRATVLRGGRPALDDVTLRLEVGQHTAIVGANGSGKSTLVQLLAGRIYPLARADVEAPLRILGRTRWNVDELRARLGVLSADVHHRFVSGSSLGLATARQAVVASFFGSEVVFQHHLVDEAAVHAAEQALDDAGVAHLADARMNHMSTGEARRVLIARALVHNPATLLLDEPTTGLDPVARHELLEQIRHLARSGTTIVLVTHHLEEVVPEIQRVILLKQGRIDADGAPAETLTSARVSSAFGRPLEIESLEVGYRVRIAGSDHSEEIRR